MSDLTFPPPYCPLAEVADVLRRQGFVAMAPQDVARLAHTDEAALQALSRSWEGLERDAHLRDGGRYRRRRHASLIVEGGTLALQPHRAHYQPLTYNALHGGMHRWFAPIHQADVASAAFAALVLGLSGLCSRLMPVPGWFVEAHQFRIDTTDGIGRPTPEGAHRDGVDFVAVLLVAREGIIGGETRVFDYAGPDGQRFTLDAPWSLLFMEDARVIHESTPVRPARAGTPGHRDTLVLTFRRDGFLDEGNSAATDTIRA